VERPLRITLDQNCIIALEEERPYTGAIRHLIAFQNQGYIVLNVSAFRGDENRGSGKPELDLKEQIFHEADRAHLAILGLEKVHIYKDLNLMRFTDGSTFLYDIDLDIFFYEFLRNILFPNKPFEPNASGSKQYQKKGLDKATLREIRLYQFASLFNCSLDPVRCQKMEQLVTSRADLIEKADAIRHKENNAHCDVMHLLTHASWGGDIFVTNDDNFHKQSKHGDLEALTGGMILRPLAAVEEVKRFIGGQPRRVVMKGCLEFKERLLWLVPEPEDLS
jgi:hypothetical protein